MENMAGSSKIIFILNEKQWPKDGTPNDIYINVRKPNYSTVNN